MKIPEDPIDRAMLFLQLNSMGKLELTDDEKKELSERITTALFKPNWFYELIKRGEKQNE